MKSGPFVEGISILAKYVNEDEYVSTEHDVLWFGPEASEVSDEDTEHLKELGWMIDEEKNSWFCFTS